MEIDLPTNIKVTGLHKSMVDLLELKLLEVQKVSTTFDVIVLGIKKLNRYFKDKDMEQLNLS